MWQMVGILAELERSLIQERTKAGRAAAMARGVRMGRKRLLSAQPVSHARKLIEQGEGPDNVAQSLNVSGRTLYRASGYKPSKVLFKIHPPMKNADNIYSAAAQAEEKDVRTRAKFVVIGLYFRASPSDSGICRYGFDVVPKLADISFCLVNAPMTRRVIPNFIKVGLRTRRKSVT